MEIEIILILLGIFTGILSGFFGIGGGTVSVPIMLYLGFTIKEAIGISVMQMVFSSFVAYLIHRKKQTYSIKITKYFGFGGIIGAVIGAFLVKLLNASMLEWLFLSLVAFTLVKLFVSNPEPAKEEITSKPLYFGVGSGVGVFSGMLGVGGSILITPITVGFMGFPLKKAAAVGLFFVMFTSVSSFITLSWLGLVDYRSGFFMTIGSLLGIWIGIWIAHNTRSNRYKQILVFFYIFIFVITAKKLIIG
jgi:uncharacterized membrane protein YfcA